VAWATLHAAYGAVQYLHPTGQRCNRTVGMGHVPYDEASSSVR